MNQPLTRKKQSLLKTSVTVVLKTSFLIFIFSINLTTLAGNDIPEFGDRVDLGLLENDSIREASGIAASRKNADVLWVHNDSGDSNRIFALNTGGKHLGVYKIVGAKSRDWEDIAVGPGPVDGEHYIYIGNIGDNNKRYDLKYIYRIIEPEVFSDQAPKDTTLDVADRITFRFPDGRRDAETLMVDPLTKDIYIVSKRENNVRVYRAPYPQLTDETITLEHVATLDITSATGGDISPSGLEILIRTYYQIFYWRCKPDQKLWEAFDNDYITVPCVAEPQGEAVSWKSDGLGYYTTSEEPMRAPAHLYFYPRLNTNSAGRKYIKGQ